MKHLKQTILALALGQLAIGSVLAQSNVVKIDGSSTVYPITEAVAEASRSSAAGRSTFPTPRARS